MMAEPELIESCFGCRLRADRLFCDLPARALQDFDALKFASLYPADAVLFVEGQMPRGIFVLCTGRAKLSTTLRDGKRRILRIAEPGEVLGLSATISGQAYEVTAETLENCQVNFVKGDDFLRFLAEHGDACLRVARCLSQDVRAAYEQFRVLACAPSVAEKLARLLLSWCAESGEPTEQGIRVRRRLTHEEMAQLIGASRETVTRLLGEFKQKEVISSQGATLFIRDRAALEAISKPLPASHPAI
jgi:CRP/FNR family cyclic AMP-dependent transcriptional regulator